MTSRATTVIVHYGDAAPTVRLANALVDFDTDVVVAVNDASSRPMGLDAAVEWLPCVRNLGYGAAFSAACAGRRTPAFVLLNNDIVLPRETFDHCLDTLLGTPGAGVVAPVLRRADGTLQSGAATFSRWGRTARVLVDPGPSTVDCEWVTGAVMFLRREVVEGVGVDGSYFLGAEDADLCVRARKAGWQVLCCGDAPATHHQSQVITGSRWSYYAARNGVWFTRTHFGLLQAVLCWLRGVVLLPRVALADVVKRRRPGSARLTAMGLIDAWRRKPSPAEGPLPQEPIPSRVMRW